jgi:hypothetical protein
MVDLVSFLLYKMVLVYGDDDWFRISAGKGNRMTDDTKRIVTEKEIYEARENLEDDCEPMKLIERLWREVLDLRSMLEKQKY